MAVDDRTTNRNPFRMPAPRSFCRVPIGNSVPLALTNYSVEKVRLLACDSPEQWLELEPADALSPGLLVREARIVVFDVDNGAGRLRQQLCLARSFHRHEPPDRRLDRLADRQQTVVSQDDRLAITQCVSD